MITIDVLKMYFLQVTPKAIRYRLLFVSLIVFIGCNMTKINVFAQHHRIENIYQVSLADFQGDRKTNSFPIYISVEVLYKIDSVFKIAKNKFRLKVVTMVKIHKDQSFLDLAEIDKQNLPYLLKHEQGHVLITYAAANFIEKDLSAKVYTEDFIGEVKHFFLKASVRYLKLNQLYDEQTDHSRDYRAQQKWNEKMKVLFNESY